MAEQIGVRAGEIFSAYQANAIKTASYYLRVL